MEKDTPPILNNDVDIEIMGDEDLETDKDGNSGSVQGTEGEGVNEDSVSVDQGTRSVVWDHMESVTAPGGVRKNRCKHCKKILSHQSGGTTSHLMRHLKDSCPFRETYFPKPLKLKEAAVDGSHCIQTQLKGLSEGESSIGTFTFNFEKVKLLAAHMVLAHEYPFSIVEHKVFNEFLKAYTPYYRKITRYMVRKECFNVYETEKEKMKGILGKVNRVGLTTDCWWSGVQRIGYMVITVHYIDRNWNLQKRVLSFVNVPPPHNGAALAKEVHRVCNLFGISEKVASVTVDNASANDVCISILKKDYALLSNLVLGGKLFHVRCCAHIINLLVRDGLKEIEKVTEKVRDGVKYLFGSENRLSSFNEHRINLKLPPNKLVLDNNTRWNSTYVMLSTAYKYRQCFTKFGEDDESFALSYCPSDYDWHEVSEVCDFLEVFLDVTNLISGSNYPTVNLFLLELSRIKELINEQLDNLDPSNKKHMQRMAERMAFKYDKYWDECDFLLSFGSILDPRYKKEMINFAFKSMYPVDYEEKVNTVLGKFNELFDEYVKLYGDGKAKGPESSYSATCKKPPSSTVGKRKFDEFMMKMQTKGKEKSDLELYYDEACYPNVANFDALAWWKGNEGKYKVLSKMAMDIWSIPITTVASESTFSAGGRVIDKRRASMRRDTVEVLLCAGDWIKEAYGIRSLKDQGNDDPIELEYENEYDMKDPNDTVLHVVESSLSQSQVVNTTSSTRNQSKANLPSTSSIKPPSNSKKSQKKARRT